MARARLLKPDFFDDEKVTLLPFGARILFEAYWCMADREGRIEDRPSRVASFAFPPMGNQKLQAAARRDVITWRNLLVDAGMLLRYEVDDLPYLLVTNFKEHQKPHQNETKSVLPAPLATLVTIGNQRSPMVIPNITSHAIGDGSDSSSGNGSNSDSGVGVAREEPDEVGLLCKSFGRFGALTATTADAIGESVTDYGLDWVQRAVKKAAASAYEGKPPWAFVESILIRWKKQGYPDDERELQPRTHGQSRAAAGANGQSREDRVAAQFGGR